MSGDPDKLRGFLPNFVEVVLGRDFFEPTLARLLSINDPVNLVLRDQLVDLEQLLSTRFVFIKLDDLSQFLHKRLPFPQLSGLTDAGCFLVKWKPHPPSSTQPARGDFSNRCGQMPEVSGRSKSNENVRR